jgi:NDP-sugar pyrophosphorylase family protein
LSYFELKTDQFFTLTGQEYLYPLFRESLYPWEILPMIASYIKALGPKLPSDRFEQKGDMIWIARSASIAEYTTIIGPAIIGESVEVRPGAYIRGNVFVGEGSVVGNATELKNAILLGKVEVPHFNYIGDSILSYGAHLGAGVITSNLRSDRNTVHIRFGNKRISTDLRKLGALIAENVEVGCNAVLNPGVMLARGSTVYPLSNVRQYVPADFIYKTNGEMIRRITVE